MCYSLSVNASEVQLIQQAREGNKQNKKSEGRNCKMTKGMTRYHTGDAKGKKSTHNTINSTQNRRNNTHTNKHRRHTNMQAYATAQARLVKQGDHGVWECIIEVPNIVSAGGGPNNNNNNAANPTTPPGSRQRQGRSITLCMQWCHSTPQALMHTKLFNPSTSTRDAKIGFVYWCYISSCRTLETLPSTGPI